MDTIKIENYTQRNTSNSKSVLIWSFLWGLSLIIAGLAVALWWPNNTTVLVISIILHLSFAVGALKAHLLWLKGLDELQQKIQFQSMAFTLGLTWIALLLMLLLNMANVIEVSMFHISLLTVGMAVSSAVGNFIGMRKAS
ncbi:hypothetical protein [Algibacillus agarilyticus]|uniref:hypothetical protein n=1 Tax=Algibacillus agarilyticus TaxID=2234133 RepID=UPI000DCFB32C|nr:hypothetical protein [Algibacillus agarilyticus]